MYVAYVLRLDRLYIVLEFYKSRQDYRATAWYTLFLFRNERREADCVNRAVGSY